MFEIIRIKNRQICIKGVGKLFYQDGYPISMAVSLLKQKDIEVSVLHIADECLKNGWSTKTVINKIKADLEDDIEKNNIDLSSLETFCNSTYEDQREMIFNYLFKISTNEVRNNKEYLNDFKFLFSLE